MNEYPAVAGHQLYDVDATQIGEGHLVYVCDLYFRQLGAAIEYAKQHPLSFTLLASEYTEFGLRNGLTWLGSADEHLLDERLTHAQRLWLVEFCRRWQSVAEFEAEEESRDG